MIKYPSFRVVWNWRNYTSTTGAYPVHIQIYLSGHSPKYFPIHIPGNVTAKQWSAKGIIDYTYDADGGKLRKQVTDSTGGTVKVITTDYISGFMYEKDTLRHISHEEGRIRPVFKSGMPLRYFYDYFEKDHLGNVRVVLTEQPNTTFYLASMEVENGAVESALFSNIEGSRSARPIGYPKGSHVTKDNGYVARLNGKDPDRKIGPSIVLRVMAGDTISVGARAFYKSRGPVDRKQPLISATDIAVALARAFSSGSPGSSNKITSGEVRANPFSEQFFANDYQRLKKKDLERITGISGRRPI